MRAAAVDLRGATLAPGFVDAHVHAFGCAMTSLTVSCLPPAVDSLLTLKSRLRERAAALSPGSWVVGTGYDDSRLLEQRHPSLWDLDEAAPDHPVLVTRVCGHMSVANTRALELAGIDRATSDPPGGAVVRDQGGEPTGLLLERAQELVQRIVPVPGNVEIARALHSTGEAMLAHGITTICEALLGVFHPRESAIWERVLSDGWRGPDVRFLQDSGTVGDAAASQLPVVGTKLFADGVVTGGTAALSEPFEGANGIGMLIHSPDDLTALVTESSARGLPVGIHAMGDRGIAAAIDAIEHAEKTRVNEADASFTPRPGHRIEHCAVPTVDSLRRMKKLGISPVPQPVFLFAEGEAYLTAIGRERCSRAYPLRTMIDVGLRPALSSDAPATSWQDPLNPWLGVVTAAKRKTWAGTVLGEREAISIAEALAAYTANGASALGIEDRTGSIKEGKVADLIVLPEDPLTLPVDELPSLRPTAVLVGGKVAWGALP